MALELNGIINIVIRILEMAKFIIKMLVVLLRSNLLFKITLQTDIFREREVTTNRNKHVASMISVASRVALVVVLSESLI